MNHAGKNESSKYVLTDNEKEMLISLINNDKISEAHQFLSIKKTEYQK